MSEQLNFEQMIEESMKNIAVKEIIEGTIININKKGEVIIDIGYKADGIIPRNEYSYNEAADPSKELKVGDKITAEVIKMNDGEGNVLLSTKRYKMKEAQKELEEKFKNNEVLEEKITEITDKGFIISKEGYNIFIPIAASAYANTFLLPPFLQILLMSVSTIPKTVSSQTKSSLLSLPAASPPTSSSHHPPDGRWFFPFHLSTIGVTQLTVGRKARHFSCVVPVFATVMILLIPQYSLPIPVALQLASTHPSTTRSRPPPSSPALSLFSSAVSRSSLSPTLSTSPP